MMGRITMRWTNPDKKQPPLTQTRLILRCSAACHVKCTVCSGVTPASVTTGVTLSHGHNYLCHWNCDIVAKNENIVSLICVFALNIEHTQEMLSAQWNCWSPPIHCALCCPPVLNNICDECRGRARTNGRASGGWCRGRYPDLEWAEWHGTYHQKRMIQR